MLRSMRVRDYMNIKPEVVSPDTDLFVAIKLILDKKLSGLTVVDEGRPVGMLSELDCMQAILSASYYQEGVGVHKVADLMSSPVDSVGPDDAVIDVAKSMLEQKRRRRPVVDAQGTMIGQVTCRQLLRVIRDLEVPS